ncbi:MAG: hypothetical protein WC998_09845 [Candidatus Paceibacterota bacterium]|jgi:hypothetical protein
MDAQNNQAQVVEAVGFLIDRINVTADQLSDLEKRLDPIILSRPEAADCAKEAISPNRCLLAQQIFDYADKVNTLNKRINRLLTTLEI